jgi:Uma2 family endonuclease
VNGRSAGHDSGAGSTGGTGGTGPSRISPASLAVEVMSPGSVTEDRITKPAVYARAGIPHYWRLESGDEGELALYVYRLAGDVYTEAACFRGDDRVEIDEPLRLRFPLAALLG